MPTAVTVIEAIKSDLTNQVSDTDRLEFVKAAKENRLSDLHLLYRRKNGEHLAFAAADNDTDVLLAIIGPPKCPSKLVIEKVIERTQNRYRNMSSFARGILSVLAPFMSPD